MTAEDPSERQPEDQRLKTQLYRFLTQRFGPSRNQSWQGAMSTLSHPNECIVVVRRQWNDCQLTASYRLDDVSNFHWADVSGGVRVVAPQPFVYGYVLYDQMIKRTKGPPTVNISMGQLPLKPPAR